MQNRLVQSLRKQKIKYKNGPITLHLGDASHIPYEDGYFHSIVTSPPYYRLRKYSGEQVKEWLEVSYSPIAGMLPITIPAWKGPLSWESSPEAFIGHLVLIAREWWRVLRPDGVVWLNFGDSYVAGGSYSTGTKSKEGTPGRLERMAIAKRPKFSIQDGNLFMMPQRVALALQADGWIVRNDNVWAKKQVMPESQSGWRWKKTVGEKILRKGSWRHTRAHEFVFMLVKSMHYWIDGDVVKEPAEISSYKRIYSARKNGLGDSQKDYGDLGINPNRSMKKTLANPVGNFTGVRNPRTVLRPASLNYYGKHYATYSPGLIELLIKSSCPAKCCPACGLGWSPVITSDPIILTYNEWLKTQKGGSKYEGRQPGSHKGMGSEVLNFYKEFGDRLQRTVIGYAPSCECGIEESVPGIILDPVCGSGTTGLVCASLGLGFVGIDTSEEYLNQAKERIEGIGNQDVVLNL